MATEWRDTPQPCQTHAYGEWVVSEDGTIKVRRCCICAAVQQRPNVAPISWRENDENIPLPEHP